MSESRCNPGRGRKRHKASLSILLFLFILGCAAAAPAQQVNATTSGRVAYPSSYDWPSFLYSSNHSAVSPSTAPLSNKTIAHVKLNGSITSSVVLSDGIAFVGGGKQFRAVNSSTLVRSSSLHQGWNFTVGGAIDSTPVVGGGRVFIGATDGKVYGFDSVLSSCPKPSIPCHLDWTFSTGGAIHSSPTYDSGMVFVGSDDGKVYCLNAATGSLVWVFSTTDKVRTSPTVASSSVFVGSDDGNEYFLKESTGSLKHVFAASGPIESTAAFSNGAVYFGSNDSYVYAVGASNGSEIWKMSTGGPVSASPAVADGRVYVGSTDGYFYSLHADARHIQTVWKTLLGPIGGSSALANGVAKGLRPTYLGMAYVASTNGHLYAIVRSTGEVYWSLPVSLNSVSSPTIGYTKLYFGDEEGNLTEVGSLRGGTAAGVFSGTSFAKKFLPGTEVTLGANSAWGKFGINQSLVTVLDPNGNTLIDNQTMQFVPGIQSYNFVYKFTLGADAAMGKYKVIMFIEDGHAKSGSNNPRCCGWIVDHSAFEVI
jgi:outer membrane protein assembly factor BamB